MVKQWTADEVLGMARSHQSACVLAAAVDWDVFSVLSKGRMTASALATMLGTHPRATTILLDALAAIGLLEKDGAGYGTPGNVAEILSETGPRSVLPMVRHQANCLRRWAQLSSLIKSGGPAESRPSVRGEAADQAAFIGAMHTVSAPVARELVARIGPPKCRHLLDIGGGSGTWTIEFLRAMPDATATIFDLPHVMPMARQRIADAGLTDRVTLIAGDFYTDALPVGADVAWISAIAHQNSRPQNRELLVRTRQSLAKNGIVMIRDVVMDDSRTRPVAGALFAINMLVATEGGGTYTLGEFREDLRASGFVDIELLLHDESMNSVIRARRP